MSKSIVIFIAVILLALSVHWIQGHSWDQILNDIYKAIAVVMLFVGVAGFIFGFRLFFLNKFVFERNRRAVDLLRIKHERDLTEPEICEFNAYVQQGVIEKRGIFFNKRMDSLDMSYRLSDQAVKDLFKRGSP